MPTGYTADLYEGKEVSFPEFAMQCARAMGATITMRDDPADAPIPEEFQPSDWNLKRLEEARERVAEVEGWSSETADIAAQRDYADAMNRWREMEAESKARRERYDAMLEQVRAWTPPTPDHEEFKAFMENQLVESKRFDGWHSPKPVRIAGPDYREQQLANALHDIDYHTKEHAKEVERATNRTEWVRALRQSLEPVSA